MKLLVAIKRVVDANVTVRVKSDGSGVETDGVKMSINPFDEIALEEALRIKEKGGADEVVSFPSEHRTRSNNCVPDWQWVPIGRYWSQPTVHRMR